MRPWSIPLRTWGAICRMPWHTKDSEPGLKCRVFSLPDDSSWLADFIGALIPLTRAWNWEQVGTLSPDEMAQFWTDVLAGIDLRKDCMSIGTVLFTAGSDKPDNALWCNGAEVEQSAYPLLYDVLGNTWGSASPGNFKLPDLRDRVPVGTTPGSTGDYGLGDTGGAKTHTLTTDEIPAHTHSVHDHETGVIGLEILPASTPALTSGTSGSTGGGEAHNNMPPYAALNAYIIAF